MQWSVNHFYLLSSLIVLPRGMQKLRTNLNQFLNLKKSVDALPQKKNEEKLSSKTKLRTRNEGDD